MEVMVLILSVVSAVIVIVVGEVIIKAREAMAWSSSEPGRQQWTWDGYPRDGEILVGL